MKNIYKVIIGLLLILLVPVVFAASETSTPFDKVKQGKSTATDKDYVFNIGAGAANPVLRGKASTNKVQFSHNGVDFKDIGSGSGGGGGGVVLNLNGGFEEGLGNWAASGGTLTLETTAANVGFATQAGAWDASAASQTLSNDAVTIPAGLYGKVCTLSWYYKGGDANLKAQVFDGTNVIAESSAFTAQTSYSSKQVMYFTCPSSGTMRARFIASADAALVYIDDVKLGQEVVANGGGYQIYGTLVIPTTGGACGDGWSVSASGAFADIPADNGCNAPTVTGQVLAASTNIPGFRVADAGDYIVTVNGGRLSNTNVSDGATGIRITDGVNFSQGVTIPTTAASTSSSSWSGNFTFLLQGVAANSTIRVQLAPKSGTTATWHNGTASSEQPINFTVSRINSAAVDTITVDKTGWYVEGNIGGAQVSLGTSTVSSYTEITNSTLDLVLKSGSASAEIACSSTNPSTGLTCSAGNEGLGIAFNPPSAGTYEVCFDFSWGGIVAAGADVQSFFQVVETPNNAQTILSTGNERLGSRIGVSGAAGNANIPQHVCGLFTANDTSKKTYRVMYTQNVSGTVNGSLVEIDRSTGALGNRDARVSVRRRVELADVVRIASFTSAPVTASAYGNAGATSGNQPIVFPLKEDPDNLYNTGTGRFTVPSGKTVCVGRWFTTGDGVNRRISCYKNAAQWLGAPGSDNSGLGSGAQSGSCHVRVTGGDLLDIRSDSTMTGSSNANASFTCW